MSERFKHYDEIASSLRRTANNNQTVTFEDFLSDMKSYIIDQYSGENLNTYRGFWKDKFKKVAEELNYTVGKDSNINTWANLVEGIKQNRLKRKEPARSTSSSSSSSSNRILTPAEKEPILELYTKIEEKHKGTLSTGKKISDCMYDLAKASVFEHPVHSFIFDTSDSIWETYLTAEELKEAKHYNNKLAVDIPDDLQLFLNSFENEEYKTASQYYDHALNLKFPLGTSFDKRWAQESIISACELFDAHNNRLILDGYTEGDMLNEVWSFVYKLYKDREIVAKLGEAYSVATSMSSLEAVKPRERKMMGAKTDIVFVADKNELGACEVRKGDVSIVGDKYLKDGLEKLPKTLRDMLVAQITINPEKANCLCTVGYLIIGVCMELLVVDMPFGNLISRVVRSSRLPHPIRMSNFATDLVPLLELAYMGKQIMQKNIIVLDDRKRRKVFDSGNDDNTANETAAIPLSLI